MPTPSCDRAVSALRRIACARRGGRPVGVAAEWSPESRVLLLGRVAVRPDVRGPLTECPPRRVLGSPRNGHKVAWAVWRLGGDRDAALRLVGEAVLTEEGPHYGPVDLLGDFGPAAAGRAGRVRYVMDRGDVWLRLRAAAALWSVTGEPEPSRSVLEEYILPDADGGAYGFFLDALRVLAGIGTVSPEALDTLRKVRASDRRLSAYGDYRAFLRDEEIRSAIDDVLAPP